MPKYAKKVDASQSQIVKDLRDAQVQTIVTNFGNDFPDLLTGFEHWVLIELKEIDGSITRGQLKFISEAKGFIGLATDFDSAFLCAVMPRQYCFRADEQDRIAAWLELNPNVKTIAVRKFFREVLNREI